MSDNDRPRNDACDDIVAPGLHTLETAWNHTWCSCDHTAMVEQHDPHHDGIDADNLPVWWNRALREQLPESPEFDFETAWSHLRVLARDLAADGTYERWDEFASHVMELDQDRAEKFLKLLDAAGISSVAVGSWDYRDGKNRWHGEDCGCLLIDVRLLAEQK